jgi:hypothetical protein
LRSIDENNKQLAVIVQFRIYQFPTTRQALIKIFAMQFVWFLNFSSVQDSWQRRKIETCQKYRTQRGLITAVELKAVQLWSEIIVRGLEQVQSS